MKKIIIISLGLFLFTGALLAGNNEMQELSGILHKPIKSSAASSEYYIELDGTLNTFNIQGEILKKFKEGERILVKGYIVTELSPVINADTSVQQPLQWLIYMKVIEAERIEKPFGLEK